MGFKDDINDLTMTYDLEVQATFKACNALLVVEIPVHQIGWWHEVHGYFCAPKEFGGAGLDSAPNAT